MTPEARRRALDLISFIDACPTPYHAVAQTVSKLETIGFTALHERNAWALTPGDRRFVTRNDSSIIAFVVGEQPACTGGFNMVGAHTDSPNLKLKPKGAFTAFGYRQVGVEIYGGVLLATWLDRDLGLAGRLVVRGADAIESKLVDIRRPVLRVANLAIHLNREVNKDGLKLNKQIHMAPLWGVESDDADEAALMKLLAEDAGVDVGDILDHDLSCYDLQGGRIGGVDDAFVFTARLDNLASCHSGLTALSEACDAKTDATRVIVFNDHEEVGSRSAHGAAGPFLKSVLERIVDATGDERQGFSRAIAASFLISADMAHAVHPNYADRHEPQHMPMIGKGPVIKTNANQSYATDGESSGRFTSLCKDAGFTPQNFVTRTDLGCGSTIGPITSAQLGVKTIDVGNPMLSMHSCREMAGAADVDMMHRALVAHFRT